MNDGAKQMYQSINKFDALPDYIQVWPGHGQVLLVEKH
jgi:hydroxyacylglutathione hydrolase